MIRSEKYLRAAKDQSCIYCGCNDGTVVACHYQGIRSDAFGRGTGIKAHDILVAHLCAKCHALFDSYEVMSDTDFNSLKAQVNGCDATEFIKKLIHSEELMFRILLTIVRGVHNGDINLE